MSDFHPPTLPGWVTIQQAADLLGVTKQNVHKMVLAGQFKTVHQVGAIYVLATSEVESVRATREDNLVSLAESA